MEKRRRSQLKKYSLQAKIIRHMRLSKGLSMREAGAILGCSDSTICHYEHGRMDLAPKRIAQIVQAYGFAPEDFEAFMNGRTIPTPFRDECIAMVEALEETKLQAVHAVLKSLSS